MDEIYKVVVLRITPQDEEQVYEVEYEPDEDESKSESCAQVCANALRVALGGIEED